MSLRQGHPPQPFLSKLQNIELIPKLQTKFSQINLIIQSKNKNQIRRAIDVTFAEYEGIRVAGNG